MVGPNVTLLNSAGCSLTVAGQDLITIREASYFLQAGCAGTAYAEGASDQCASGPSSTFYRRVSPMAPVSVTPLSSFFNGSCQVFTGGGPFFMFPMVSVTLPSLPGPFTIVTQ